MLLRLRQLCSHPSLIQEDGVAFVGPDEYTVSNGGQEKHAELMRAAKLVSQDFVERMKAKLKEVVLERMAAEEEVRVCRLVSSSPFLICYTSLPMLPLRVKSVLSATTRLRIRLSPLALTYSARSASVRLLHVLCRI